MGCCISKCKPKTIKRQPRFDLNNLVRHKLAVIPQPPPLTSAAPPPLSLNNKISPYPPSPSSISSSTTTITSFSPSTSRSLIFSADYLGSSYKHNAPLLRVNSLKPNPFSSPMKPVSPVIRHFPQQPSPQRVLRSTTLKRARPSPPSPTIKRQPRFDLNNLVRHKLAVIPQPPPLTSAAPPPLSLNNKISPYPPSPSSISSSTTTITSFSPSTSRSLIFSDDYLGSSYKHNSPLLRVNSFKPNPFSSPMKPVSPVIRHFPQQPSPQRVSRSTTLKRARPSPPSLVRQKSLRKEEDLLRRCQVGGRTERNAKWL
ncbi:hypothetical protein SDJN02_06880, partial [Cucurbita argyrosperma subsp. argyrosperma]